MGVGVEVCVAAGVLVGSVETAAVSVGAGIAVAGLQAAKVTASRLKVQRRGAKEVRREGMGRILPEKK